MPSAVATELETGRAQGYNTPDMTSYAWVKIMEANPPPSEWLSLDLGAGELAALALALQHRDRVVLLDDALARKLAQAANLQVWGTLRILLEAKTQELTPTIKPWLTALAAAGMWLSQDIQRRILALANEEL